MRKRRALIGVLLVLTAFFLWPFLLYSDFLDVEAYQAQPYGTPSTSRIPSANKIGTTRHPNSVLPMNESFKTSASTTADKYPDYQNRRLAMVTVLSSQDYIPGALVLLNSWKKHTPTLLAIDTVSLVVKGKFVEADLQVLRDFGWIVHQIDIIKKNRKKDSELHSINFTKLRLWSKEANLTMYDQVLYFDCDTLVLGEMYQLLHTKYLPFSAVERLRFTSTVRVFNSGLMSLKSDENVVSIGSVFLTCVSDI